jgi:hypothetical protein
MRYPIQISSPWQGLFWLFGFRVDHSYVELEGEALRIHFGTADELIPLNKIAKVELRKWPFYFGLGPKIGPDGGVSYVGSTDGVVQIDFIDPRRMNVCGPFRVARARCVIVSLENAAQFIEDVKKLTE